MILALALLALQDGNALEWAELPLPPAALAPPTAVLPPALPPAGHLQVGGRRQARGQRESGADGGRMGLSELSALLEEEARQAGDPLSVLYGAPPLLAGGSPAALARARATCAALAAVSSQSIEVEAWLLPGRPAEPGPVLLPAGAPRPSGAAWHASALPGATVFLGERREQGLLATYDVEVATDSSVADPVVGSAYSGTTLHLRAWPVERGAAVFVEGVLDLAELLSLETLEPGSGDLGLLHRPELAAVQLRFSGRVESGGALRLTLEGAPLTQRDWTLHLAPRVVGGGAQATDTWSALDLGFLASRADGSALAVLEADGSGGAALVQPLEPAALWGRIAPQLARSGRSLARTVGQFALVPAADRATLQSLEALVSTAEAARTRTVLVVLEDGELRAGLAVAAGRAAGLAVGVETLRLADYAVEIAQETWIAGPEVLAEFDGLLLGGVLADDGFRYSWSRSTLAGLLELGPRETAHGRLELAERVTAAGTGTATESESASSGAPRVTLRP